MRGDKDPDENKEFDENNDLDKNYEFDENDDFDFSKTKKKQKIANCKKW